MFKRNSQEGRITQKIYDVLGSAWTSDPEAMRKVAKHIRTAEFSAEADEQEALEAIAVLFELRAAKKEQSYREAFADKDLVKRI